MLRLFCSFSLIVSSLSFAQTTVLFEDFTNGIPSNWAIVNQDGNSPETTVSEFTNAWVSYETSTDTSAASTSYYTNGEAAEDYLILPNQSLLAHSKLSWKARSVDPSYPDSYYVLLSTTDSLISSFTDTLLNVTGENYVWNRKSILLDTAGYSSQDVFIAFCNYTTDGFILELDDIQMEVSEFTSIDEEESVSFNIYPNPVSDVLTIDFKGDFIASVYSLDGQILMTSTENKIKVSEFAKGTYVIQLTSDLDVLSKTFVVR